MSQNIKNADLKLLHKEFLEYLEVEKGRSLKTIDNYGRYLKKFFEFSQVNSAQEIGDDLVRRYRLWLNRIKTAGDVNLNKKTQNYYLIALRVFLKYLAKRGIKSLAPERIELAKTLQRDLDLITEEELARLLDAPLAGEKCIPLRTDGKVNPTGTQFSASSFSLKSLRDKAILEILFSTGLRVSELCALNRYTVSEAKSGELSVRGKGGKIRVVFVSESAKKALKDYLDKRTDTEEALFMLTPRSVERIIKHYAIKAGISKKVTPHVIRHCFATDLLSAGADLRSVQSLLGHSNIATTQIYTHVTDKQLREVHRAFHGRRRISN